MNAVGIIAEYNPLHNGHIYHISQARRLSGCECVVVALSGDFVQRGEPAIINKWSRTAMALANGADLVVEIPTVYCLGNAGQYANGGVKTLEALAKISHIAFGSESRDAEGLTKCVKLLNRYDGQLNEAINELIKTGKSYPAARELALKSIGGYEELELGGPNDILAVEYIRRMKTAEPVIVERLGAGYHDNVDETVEFQSATGIRNLLRKPGNDDMIKRYVPANVMETLAGEKLCFPENLWDTLRFAIMSTSAEAIDNCPSGGEGLGNLFKSEVLKCDSLDDFMKAVKSKRYTYTRLSRLCMQIILGIRREDADLEPGYIRVLGFNEKGRSLLKEIKDEECATLPILTNINKEADMLESDSSRRILDIDIHAADIYNLIAGRNIAEWSDHRMRPVIMK